MIVRALATRVSAFSYSSVVITVTHTPAPAILHVLTNQIVRCLGLHRVIQKLWPVLVVDSLKRSNGAAGCSEANEHSIPLTNDKPFPKPTRSHRRYSH